MKKYILSVFSLAILIISLLPGCTDEKNDINYDIPIYPGAELVTTGSWSAVPIEEPWSNVEWHYYLAADKYDSDEVASFYEAEMLTSGWQDISDLLLTDIEEILWDYHQKINLYIPPNIVGRLGSWGYYTKKDRKQWAAIWTGINNEWELADKIYIVIMIAE